MTFSKPKYKYQYKYQYKYKYESRPYTLDNRHDHCIHRL